MKKEAAMSSIKNLAGIDLKTLEALGVELSEIQIEEGHGSQDGELNSGDIFGRGNQDIHILTKEDFDRGLFAEFLGNKLTTSADKCAGLQIVTRNGKTTLLVKQASFFWRDERLVHIHCAARR